MRRAALAAAAAAVGVLCCTGTAILGGGMSIMTSSASASTCGTTDVVDVEDELPDVDELTDEQVRHAAVIIAVGQSRKVPPRGWVIAVATALQESGLRNLRHLGADNDHDSVGLFQQRPSAGWGTPQQLRDPQYAAGKFYAKLLTVAGWATISLTDAAQAVQNSAYPDAYAKHEPLATVLVNSLAGGAGRAAGTATGPRCTTVGEIAASGWTQPIKGTLGGGFRTAARPRHQGVDITAAKHTPVHAASAGVVRRVRCNITPASYGCDRDGSRDTPGCGWYVDIAHAGGVITRYCHLVARPLVDGGQHVDAGQQIGFSGSSGHSSGPHLHYEIHLRNDASAQGATDPDEFMRAKGAPLQR